MKRNRIRIAFMSCSVMLLCLMGVLRASAETGCVTFQGEEVCATGAAQLETDGSIGLAVSGLTDAATDGLSVDTSDSNRIAIELEDLDGRNHTSGELFMASGNGEGARAAAGGLRMVGSDEGWVISADDPRFESWTIIAEAPDGQPLVEYRNQDAQNLHLKGIIVRAYRIVIVGPGYYYEEWCIEVIATESAQTPTVVIGDEEVPVSMLTLRGDEIPLSALEGSYPDRIMLRGSNIDQINITGIEKSNQDVAGPDLGDAPDETNHLGSVMTAYTGVPARYPTVFNPATGLPSGPLHRNDPIYFTLGQNLSWEEEADVGFDSDWGINNIDPDNNTPDLDRFDDGLILPTQFSPCELTELFFSVDVLPANTLGEAYINIWIDWDQNGNWGEISDCPQGVVSQEWAVQNQVISVGTPGYFNLVSLPFYPPADVTFDPSWIRITLSETPATDADGRGAANGWDFGETEDYLWAPEAGQICGTKWNDENGNSVQDGGENGIANWPIYIRDSNGNIITVFTDANGNWCVDLEPGDYTIYEIPGGMVQTFPPTIDYHVTIAVGDQLTGYDFGNKEPCDDPLSESCSAGTHDQFTGAEPTYVSPTDIGTLQNVCSSNGFNQFDAFPNNQCFAHTFDVTQGDTCLDHDCIVGATVTMRVASSSDSLSWNDTINFVEDGTFIWGSRIENLPAVATGWGPNQTRIITFDLTNMPNGGANILASVMDGDLTILVADDTGVDYIDLDIEYCDDEPQAREGDLGDAPDSTNHFGVPMSAYPWSTPGDARYPTVFDITTGAPPGPLHIAPRQEAWLGEWVTQEDEADINPLFDEDTVTNINPSADTNNRDGADDGVDFSTLQLSYCGRTQFDYTVTSAPTGTIAEWWVNVWFDFNQDGDWEDILECQAFDGTVQVVYEWAVQNQNIGVVLNTPNQPFTTPFFPAMASADGEQWMRITLSGAPVAWLPFNQPADGRGPDTGYRFGETEDYPVEAQPQGECDLRLKKDHTPTNFEYGGVGTYLFDVANAGSGVCEGPITITDTLPEGMSFVNGSETGAGWSCVGDGLNPETVVCTHPGPLNPASSLPTLGFDVNVPTIPNAGGQGWNGDIAVNCAFVSNPNDVNSNNNESCDEVIVVTAPEPCDLTIDKSHTPNMFEYGGVGTWQLVVSNMGTGVCQGPITVTDVLPQGMSFIPGSETGAGWTCTGDGLNPETVTCTHAGPLPGTSSLPMLTFDVNVPTIPNAGGSGWNGDIAVNCARVSNPNDVDLTNNSDCDQVIVIVAQEPCDLTIEKSHTPNMFEYGGVGTWQLVVSNMGTGMCQEPITVTDVLPMGMSFINGSETGTGWNCTGDGLNPETVTCTHAGPLPGTSSLPMLTFDVNVPTIANAGGQGWNGDIAVNCARVSNSNDVDLTNNDDCDEVIVVLPQTQCDLAIEKTHAPDPFTYGAVGWFNFVVSNMGTDDCEGPIVISDTLPEGMQFDPGGVFGAGWTCTGDGLNPETVTCTHAGPVAATSSLPMLTFRALLPTAANAGGFGWNGDVATNCATVSVNGDVNTSNNSDCTDVVCEPCQDGTVIYHYGDEDNYSPAGIEVTNRSAALDDFITYPFDADYDETAVNRFFGETLTIPPLERRRICGAQITIGLRQLGTLDANDTIRFDFIQYNGGTAGQAVVGAQWSRRVIDVITTNPDTITLDLAALPLANGSTQNLVYLLDSLRWIDVMVQDDTAVDFIDLTVNYCCDEWPELYDLGDAPDSTNHFGNTMTAYPTLGVAGRFPTVYDGSTAPGMRHTQPEGAIYLGAQVSEELDADLFPDADTVTNLDPNVDLSDRDWHDDGVRMPVRLPICNQTEIEFSATNLNALSMTGHVNVWIDFNQDGDWEDTIFCDDPINQVSRIVKEWAVQDQLISMAGSTSALFATTPFNAMSAREDGQWMRITVSEAPAVAPFDGRGPVGGYDTGETEDYLIPPRRGGIGGTKWFDANGNGVREGDEVGIQDFIIIVENEDGARMTATTDENGDYSFDGLLAGTYRVFEVMPNGWLQTFPVENGGRHVVELAEGQIIDDVDFGNKRYWEQFCVARRYVRPNADGISNVPVTIFNRTPAAQNYALQFVGSDGSVAGTSSMTVPAGAHRTDVQSMMLPTGLYRVEVMSAAGDLFGCGGEVLPPNDTGVGVGGQDAPTAVAAGESQVIGFPVTNDNGEELTIAYAIRADVTQFDGAGRSMVSGVSLDGAAAGESISGTVTVGAGETMTVPVAVAWSGSAEFIATIILEADVDGDGVVDDSADAPMETATTTIPTAVGLNVASIQSPMATLPVLLLSLLLGATMFVRRRIAR